MKSWAYENNVNFKVNFEPPTQIWNHEPMKTKWNLNQPRYETIIRDQDKKKLWTKCFYIKSSEFTYLDGNE